MNKQVCHNIVFLISVATMLPLCGCETKTPHVIDPVDNSAIFERADESFSKYKSDDLDLSDFVLQTEKKNISYQIINRIYESETREDKLENRLIGEWNSITKKNWVFMCNTIDNTSALTADLPFYVDDEYDNYLSSFFSEVEYYDKCDAIVSDITFSNRTSTFYVDFELNAYVKDGDYYYRGNKTIDRFVVVNNALFYQSTIAPCSYDSYDYSCNVTYGGQTIEVDNLSKYLSKPLAKISERLSINCLLPKDELIKINPLNNPDKCFYFTISGRRLDNSPTNTFGTLCYNTIYNIIGPNLYKIGNYTLDTSQLLALFE